MICFEHKTPWVKHSFKTGIVYATETIRKDSCFEVLSKLNSSIPADNRAIINDWLKLIENHFAIICCYKDGYFAATDRISSYPVFLGNDGNSFKLGNHAPRLVSSSTTTERDPDGCLSLAMAGYVVGKRSTVKGLRTLTPGEAVIIRKNETTSWEYNKYLPGSKISDQSKTKLENELAETTLSILDNIRVKANGRQIAVPLSAGFDSRLVASGLRYLGTKDLLLFSYGLQNNFEALTARHIAEKLNAEWHYVPLSIHQQRQFYLSSTYKDYLNFAHNHVSTPFQQDIYPVHKLREQGVFDADTIIINGNTGDFISGGHIPPFLQSSSSKVQASRFIESFLNKHFFLWENRFSAEQYNQMGEILLSELKEDELEFDGLPGYALWERMEFLNRQSKYVISGQRIYDFFNLDWELPLWHDAYLNFWSKVPLSLKANQKLYKEMLWKQNWGGVWSNIPVNNKKITPRWIVPLRFMAKAACAPFGKKTWHQMEKRFFAYWMDWGGNYAIAPYWQLATSPWVARNSVSLHTEAYLRRIENELRAESK